ncbi:YD repeat-containing protein [Candidatus Magnetomorum sp. HK-1]|nr:YD repeat-containing protein [Candidatus Magnetomorum sp. HK-1]
MIRLFRIIPIYIIALILLISHIIHAEDQLWQWQNPAPQGNPLYAVWALSDTQFMAAGALGTLIEYDGSTWHEHQIPTIQNIKAIWSADTNNRVAVGDSGQILHFFDDKWHTFSEITQNPLNAVWGKSSSDIFAFGDAGTIAHYYNDTWTIEKAPTAANLIDAIGFSDGIYVVGTAGTVLYFDGQLWQVQNTQLQVDFTCVWGTDSQHLYACGTYFDELWRRKSSVYKFDGNKWEKQWDFSTDDIIRHIWGDENNRVFAVSEQGRVFELQNSQWVQVFETQGLYRLHHMGNSFVGVGENGQIIRENNSNWNDMSDGHNSSVNAIWGDSTQAFAVCHDGSVLYWRDNSWILNSQPTSDSLYDISGNDHNIFIVGQSGFIAAYDGQKFNQQSTPTNLDLFAISVVGETAIAVGERGLIIHYQNNTWESKASPTTKNLQSVWAYAPDSAFAVGKNGTILTFDGTAWTAMISPVSERLYAIWGSEPNNIFAAGKNGSMLHYDGQQWSVVSNFPSTNHIMHLWGNNPQRVYAVGNNGTICLFDGTNWQLITPHCASDLNTVWGRSEKDVFIGGENGSILHYPYQVQKYISLILPKSMKENQGKQSCQIHVSIPSDQSLQIQIQTNLPESIIVPQTVSLPAGHTMVSFEISVIDNTVHDGEKTVSIESKAEGFVTGVGTIKIYDNESDQGIWVIDHFPNGKSLAPIDHVDVQFNREINPLSFTLDDITITGPSGKIDLISEPIWTNDQTVRLMISPSDLTGFYTLTIGPNISDLENRGMDQDGDDLFFEPTDDIYIGHFLLEDQNGAYIIARSPGEKINSPISEITLEFNEPIDLTSLTVQDIKAIDQLGGTIPIQRIENLQNNRFTIYPETPMTAGNFQLTIGPNISDLAGNLMNQDMDTVNGETGDDTFICRFSIDQQGPRILFHSVFGKQNKAIGYFDLTFNETILESSFISENIEINGPKSLIPVQDIVRQAVDVYRIFIPPQRADGIYVVNIHPQITDLAGNQLDQNQNGICGEIADGFELNIFQELPDLFVEHIDHAPEAQPGKTIEIKWYVKNIGLGATSGEWQDSIYLSKDNLIGDDTLITQVTNTIQMTTDQKYFRSVFIDVPDEINTHHWIIIKTNALESQDENKYTNNFGISSYPFWNTRRAYPDLILGKISAQQTIYIEEKTSISWQVLNQGTGATSATHWMDRVFLSTDTLLDDQDFIIATIRNSDFLASGENYTQELDLNLTTDIPENDYYLIIKTDNMDQVEEFDKESNNIDYNTIPVSVQIPEPGQLSVTSFLSPFQASPGDTIPLTWTVQNVGQATIGSVNHMILLSKNKILEPDKDAILLWTNAQNYQPNRSYTLHHNIQMPSLIEMGNYYLIPSTDLSLSNNSENIFAAPITITTSIFPDLIVLDTIESPDTLKTDQLMTISWDIANKGIGKTLISNWLDYLYLSTDNVLDDMDIYVGNIRHDQHIEPMTGQRQLSKTFKIPEFLDGSYYVIVHADALQAVNESNENNNFTSSQNPVHIHQMHTDLSVQSAEIPYSAITGQKASIKWTVQNSGEDPTIENFWNDRIYLSSDQIWDETDILFGEYNQTSILNASSSYTQSLTQTIPPLMDGHYYVIIRTDALNNIYEATSENNNDYVISEPIHIHHLFPDVHVLDASCQTNAFAGETIAINYTLINAGQTGTYGIWQDVFYLSHDNTLDPATDTIIGKVLHKSQIDSGNKINIQTSQEIVLPSHISGTYTILVQIDALNQLYEYQGETNNTFTFPKPVMIQDSPSDLQVISVQAPESAFAGTAIHVTWKVENKGRQATREAFWYDRVYLSKDETFSPQYDILMGNIIHKDPLMAGDKYTCSHYFVLRQDLGGTYYIFVQTDAENQVYENNNEFNNVAISKKDIQLIGVYVDLTTSDLTFEPDAWSGQTIEISWKVQNIGFDSTRVSSWEDIIYLSKDSQPDINDIILGVYQHNGILDKDSSYVKNKTLTLPKEIQGDYYLIVHTDANAFNDVFEYQAEENNHTASAIKIDSAPTPNLKVSEINIPEFAWSGQYITIDWTVTNDGTVPAKTITGFWYDSVYLSRDPFLDVIHDISIGNVKYNGFLSDQNDSYTQQLDTMLPPGISGPYYVIVHTDSSIPNHVFETNLKDNVRISSQVIDIRLTPPADFLITDLSIPETGKPGQVLDWIYAVKNQGKLAAVGSWYDTLYLSTDQNWDINDQRIARFYQNGDIPSGSHYSPLVKAMVPAVVPGKYYVIVRSDILNDVRETNENNNMAVSGKTIQIENTILVKNDLIEGTISRGQFQYYQINTQKAEDIRILVQGLASQCSQFFMASDYIPGRSQYDIRGEMLDSDTLMLNMTGLEAGEYFISFYGKTCDPQTPFNLSVNYLDSLRIHSLSVNKGANIGMTTLNIEGAHFQDDTQVRLENDGTTFDRVKSVNVLNSGNITLTLDLNNLNEGMYDIVLENTDGEKAQIAFEVVNENRGELFARLLIPGYVSQNEIYNFTLEYGNVGHSDILAPLIVISTGEGGLLRKNSTDDFSASPIQIIALSDKYPVDVLPPHSFFSIKFEFMLTSDEYVPFYIQVMDQPEEPIDWDGLQTKLRPTQIDDQLWDALWMRFKSDMGNTWGDYVSRLRKNAVEIADYGTYIRDVETLLPNISDGRKEIILSLPIPPGSKRTSGGAVAPETEDLHDKITSIGTGTLHHILFDRTIEYTIRFENKSNAGASAQYILITDSLNDNLNADSFVLKEIAFGEYRIDIPEGHTYYHTRLDLRDSGKNLLIDIEAGLDPATRIAKWIFTAIDPDTGEPSEDPLNGFLPPNNSENQGEGYVRFQVMPHLDIESGTIINNMATIIFDKNEPVDTPIAYNTIDINLPESSVRSIYNPGQLEIEVKWGGQDATDGSGIASYDVYVSDNGKPYEIWLSKTTAISGIFMGQPGHEYAFYSIATDKVGNVEMSPQQADSVVKIENFPPIANAGSDQTVDRSSLVTLDGSLSKDPDHGIVAFSWTQTQGPQVILSNSHGITASFQAPEVFESSLSLSFALRVTDVGGLSHEDVCTVIVVDNQPPLRPVLELPYNGESNIMSSPVLQSQEFEDLDIQSTHTQTQWQISQRADFSELVLNVTTSIFLTELAVPECTLEETKNYHWRVRYFDQYTSASKWSEARHFTTTTFSLEPDIDDQSLDLDKNGEADINQTDIKLSKMTSGSGHMAVQSQSDGVSIVSVRPVDPKEMPTIGNRPAEMPFGLISFKVACAKGSQAEINIYFSESLPSNARWFKFDYNNGFEDFSSHTQYLPAQNKITITIQDGGFGDADGTANGFIVDPGGIGISNDLPRIKNEDSNGSCFIGTCASSGLSVWFLLVLVFWCFLLKQVCRKEFLPGILIFVS